MSRWKFWKSPDDVERDERRAREQYDSSPAAPTTGEYSVPDHEITDLDDFNFASWDDSSRRSLREQVSDNSRLLAIVGVYAAAALLMIAIWLVPVLPGLTSLWTWTPVIVVSIVVGLYLAGRRSLMVSLRDYTWVFAYLEEGAAVLVCKKSPNGDTYEIVRGWTMFGYRASPLKVKDLSYKLGRKQGSSLSPDDPATLRIKPAYKREHKGTMFGDVVITRGRKLTVDQDGSALLTITRPRHVDKTTFDKLHQSHQATLDALKAKKKRIQSMQNDLEQFQREATKTRKEHVDEFVERYGEVRQTEANSSAPQQQAPRQQSEHGYLTESDNDE